MRAKAGRLEGAFGLARRRRAGALLPYFTTGYPTLEVSVELLRRADRCGVAAVELGFPYSDSIADGPTIASSYEQALRSGCAWRTSSTWFGPCAKKYPFRSRPWSPTRSWTAWGFRHLSGGRRARWKSSWRS
jgi:tryptophan synthase alpha subunit